MTTIGTLGSVKPFGRKESGTARGGIHERVTDAIIRDLEQGTRSWIKPWTKSNSHASTARPLRHDGTPYRGINVLLLWSEATERGYVSPIWMTYRQVHALGGQVRKGERSTTIVYAKTSERTEDDPATGEETVKRIPLLRAYAVFNADQIDGLTVISPTPPSVADQTPSARIDRADNFVAAIGANIVHKGNRACYIPSRDIVEMPPYWQFVDTPTFYATLLHELVHYTSAPHRCNRELGKRFGDNACAREELVAEIGAAFLCADLSITLEPRPDHAAYIASWLTVLRSDKRAIFTAAALAQKESDWLVDKAGDS